jgi:6-phosphofructokinase 1
MWPLCIVPRKDEIQESKESKMRRNTLTTPQRVPTDIRRVAIVFAGGPAPAANAVISAAATAFLRNGMEVVGILYGYSHLVRYAADRPLVEGRDYVLITHRMLRRTRNSQGILIGTARTNPGKAVCHPSHLGDEGRVAPLRTVYDSLCTIDVDALISIGGDDTLKTANKFKLFQERLPETDRRIPVVHLPKTIDNDYRGIDFTFGYFTAVEFLANEVRNLLHDAEANRSYFLVESMGRSAGWLAYGVAIAGEASLVISVEDITGEYRDEEEVANDNDAGPRQTRPIMNMDMVIRRIVATITTREREGKEYGVIVIAEGLAELLPHQYLEGIGRDEHDHISISAVQLHKIFTRLISEEYHRQTKRKRKITGLQLGYEGRCAQPHAFDVMLGSQLGVGAYRALVEKGLDGVMVSVSGQLNLEFVPFEELVDPDTLVTVVRYIEPESDFQQLTRFLETYVNEEEV